MVGDRLVEHQRAMGRVGDRDHHPAGPLAVRGAAVVVRRRGLVEVGNPLDRHRRLRQQAEQLGEARLHLIDVLLEVGDDLLLARRLPLRIAVDRGAEGGEVLVPLSLRELRHLPGDPCHFLEADLVDRRRGDVDGGHRLHRLGVAPLAVRQALDRDRGPALRRVLGAQEGGEIPVRRQHVLVDRLGQRGRQLLLVGVREAGRELLQRQHERVGGDDPLGLLRQLVDDELRRHQAVLDAGAQHLGGLLQHPRNLVETRDVVLVVLHRIEGHAQRQIGQAGMDAVLLADRHLEVLQPVGDVAAGELALQELVREQVGVRHAGGGDGAQPLQVGVVLRVLPRDLRQRRVAELRVVAVIPHRGRPFRVVLQPVLVELFEQRVLFRDAVGDGSVLGVGGGADDDGGEQTTGKVSHGPKPTRWSRRPGRAGVASFGLPARR